MDCSIPGFPVLHDLLEFAQTPVPESVLPSNHLILCCPLLLLPSIFPSIRVFFSDSVLCIRWPKHWSFSFSIGPSHEYSFTHWKGEYEHWKWGGVSESYCGVTRQKERPTFYLPSPFHPASPRPALRLSLGWIYPLLEGRGKGKTENAGLAVDGMLACVPGPRG